MYSKLNFGCYFSKSYKFIFKYVLKWKENKPVIISLNKSLQESYNHSTEESKGKKKNLCNSVVISFSQMNYSLAIWILYTIKNKLNSHK